MAFDSEYLARFRADLATLSPAEMVRNYVMTEPCMGMPGVNERDLRELIAAQFAVSIDSVVIVGSAKLGFTLRRKAAKDDEPERPQFSPFSDNSDVDVAIVSDVLFDSIWKRCFEFWHSSGYANGGYWRSGKNFREYFFRGWMRPDHLPSEGTFSYRNEWFDYFRRITSERAAGDYKVTAGVYRESYFLESYQEVAIKNCRVGEIAAQ